MQYSYYPGCTLKNKARRLDLCARLSAEKLGFTLDEIDDWQCCGGTYPMVRDEIVTKLSSVRALVAARDANRPLLTICSACHNVIKQVENDMRNDEEIRDKVNNYLKLDTPYEGGVEVVHYLEVLRDKVGFDAIKKAVVRPLKGHKIGGYYGCLLLRPNKVMQFDDPENPQIMEQFIRALGGTAVTWNMRNECCGAYVKLDDPSVSEKRCELLMKNSTDMGAEALVTACPLCQYNLATSKAGDKPVYYFTELLAYALGVTDLEGFDE